MARVIWNTVWEKCRVFSVKSSGTCTDHQLVDIRVAPIADMRLAIMLTYKFGNLEVDPHVYCAM
jgi:hypothetical protein